MTTAVATKKAPKFPWGNPKTVSFAQAYIRDISFEGAEAEVNREIVDIAVQILHMAHEQGVLPEGKLVSYDKDATDGPTAYGACLGIFGGVEGAEEWGFVEHDALGLVFAGDLEAAQALTIRAQELLAERGAHEDIIPEEEQAWAHTKPGQRTLSLGSRGDDVQFIQNLLGASDHGGVFDNATREAVLWLQGQRGIAQTGEVDNQTWVLCYPRNTAFGVGRNDAGFTVRVAQALLVAYGWEPELQITGRYGVETDRAIRRLQEQRGLRVNGYMRSPEWVVLLGAREDWPSSD